MSRQPDGIPGELLRAAWPSTRAAEALGALARAAELAHDPVDVSPLASAPGGDEIGPWLEAIAERAGLQVDQTFVALEEVEALLRHGAPALVRLSALPGGPILAIVRGGRRWLRVVGSDLQIHHLPARLVAETIRQPFEAPCEQDIEQLLARIGIGAHRRRRARAAMLADRLANARFRGCWLVRLPPGARVAEEAREAGITRRLVTLGTAHVAQYALFLLSWWLLGRGVLSGTIDRGWLLGWLLLIASLIPLRLMTTWNQGVVTAAIGAWLRRRLLRGAFRVDRQELRQKGGGQLFGLSVEASAIDALALTGGVFAAFSLVELVLAMLVLVMGATLLTAPVLVLWTAAVSGAAWVYFRRRDQWTRDRLGMTEHLLACMVGHRTRLVQQPAELWHRQEDESLDRYIERGDAMDQAALWLGAVMPRGWLVLALISLTPALMAGASPARIAISLGGVLLAYRALQRLAAGLANLAGALISVRSVAPLIRAASHREPSPLRPHVASADRRETSIVAQFRDVTFRYRPQGEPVLQGCSLTVPRHARLLLEGPSGSGKSTLAALLAGLQAPESGLILAGGLDRASLGSIGWRQRVALAPQAHDNYLVTGTLAFNLLMGRRWPCERADLEEAEAVCRELGLGDLLDRLPAGLQQVVGETGWQLSQGERVRVFLARALLQKPELLVLDESFTALDPENVDRAVRCVTSRAAAVLAIAHP